MLPFHNVGLLSKTNRFGSAGRVNEAQTKMQSYLTSWQLFSYSNFPYFIEETLVCVCATLKSTLHATDRLGIAENAIPLQHRHSCNKFRLF